MSDNINNNNNNNIDILPKDDTASTAGKAKPKVSSHLWKFLIAALMLAYIILPTDLMPDPVPIVGWLDDIVAAVGMIATTISAIRKLKK